MKAFTSTHRIFYPSSDGSPVAETFIHLYAILTTLEMLKQYVEGSCAYRRKDQCSDSIGKIQEKNCYFRQNWLESCAKPLLCWQRSGKEPSKQSGRPSKRISGPNDSRPSYVPWGKTLTKFNQRRLAVFCLIPDS
jgi:hypothetical protein